MYGIKEEEVREMCEDVVGSGKACKCFIVPRKTMRAMQIIESFGVANLITVSSLEVGLIPLDDDCASLELHHFVPQIFLHENRILLAEAARAMVTLQKEFGAFDSISSKGNCSSVVASMITRFGRRDGLHDKSNSAQMDLLLLDRDLDLVTPFMTQLTFEGLIDEVLSIKYGMVSIPKKTLQEENKDQGDSKAEDSNTVNEFYKYPLNSSDELYEKIRNKPFGDALSQLADVTKFLKEQSDTCIQKTQTLSELSKFVSALPNLLNLKKSVTTFIRIAEMLTNYTDSEGEFMQILRAESELLNDSRKFTREFVEELMLRFRPWQSVLRLLILYSFINRGIKSSAFDFLREEFCRTYGYDKLIVLANLERMGWLVSEETYASSPVKNINFSKLKSTFRLFASYDSLENPVDISYTFSYSSYAPLSVRLIESFLTNGMLEINKALPDYPFTCTFTDKDHKKRVVPSNRSLLVFFIGGVTFAELAAIRFLSHSLKKPILIATTCMINGNLLLDQIQSDALGMDGTFPCTL